MAPVGLMEDPTGFVICGALGAALTLLAFVRKGTIAWRYWCFILGQTILLTAPLAAHLNRYVYGSYPTIDKEGSLLFFREGVHRNMMLHPFESLTDPAARLIGVHVGHLWVTDLFHLFYSAFGAFNVQALLYPALGWWAAWLLIRDVCGDRRAALVLAFPYGLGLHVFRDLNWYTIEKAAVFWLPLFLWALYRAHQRGGRWVGIAAVLFAVTCWMNLYLGLVAGLMAGMAVAAHYGTAFIQSRAGASAVQVASPTHHGLGKAVCLSALFALPLAIWQWMLLQGELSLASPDAFLWERAALDGFSLVPFRWNRLEVHRSLNMVALGLAMLGLWKSWSDRRVRWAACMAAVLFLLSIGPVLLPGPIENPLYFCAKAIIPGFWRVAKPEVFFQGSWLLLLCIGAIEVSRIRNARTVPNNPKGMALLYLLFLGAWCIMVRTHPAFPPMTQQVESDLAPDWDSHVFPSEGSR